MKAVITPHIIFQLQLNSFTAYIPNNNGYSIAIITKISIIKLINEDI